VGYLFVVGWGGSARSSSTGGKHVLHTSVAIIELEEHTRSTSRTQNKSKISRSTISVEKI
jgi:hypothetical protein